MNSAFYVDPPLFRVVDFTFVDLPRNSETTVPSFNTQNFLSCHLCPKFSSDLTENGLSLALYGDTGERRVLYNLR